MENKSKKFNHNQEQKKAIEHKDGPLLIVAGAGTGKTTVLVGRLNYLIEKKLAKADEILLMTFTEKATTEMEDRALELLPYGYVDLWINTFHGFCERILREHALDIGLSPNFKILNTTGQWILIKKNLEKFSLDYYAPLGNPNKFIYELVKHFSRLKDEDIKSNEYLDYAEDLDEDLDNKLGGAKKLSRQSAPRNDSMDAQEVARINELANAYHVYNKLLLDEGYLDFGDLICYTIKLFKKRPNILKHYQQKFKYIMIDEFQDTNYSQYALIKILLNKQKNLLVVGDDDQCLVGSSKVLVKNGTKRIDKIKKGEEVATAVGKGYLSYSKVNHVNKSKKETRLITFTTEKGNKIIVTDNHKMFSRVPSAYNKKDRFYFVYLMHKQETGWRIGITKNLMTRLRLERSADKIVAIKVFETEEEARFNEVLLSLKYGIPTVCFCERDGIMTKRKWTDKLFREIDVDSNARSLAKDLGINLDEYQACLGGVNRGNKVRIKINLEMCYRNYRSKDAKGVFLQNPKVLHVLSVETTHKPSIKKLEKMGFSLSNARIGKRLRISSADLEYLGKLALKIQEEIGGIIENKMKVGTSNIQHKKALIVSAGNLFAGMFLPVVSKKGINYEMIVKRKEEIKTKTVYDLEVDRTHNFIADNIVVHNSIFKFRGASLSNIMQFKEDFKEAKEVVLSKNYRSGQDILDRAYEFIKHNNPNRLEASLNINKKIESQIDKKGKIEHFHLETEQAEVEFVVDKILDTYKTDKNAKWSDFAILIRANSAADKFTLGLTRKNIPNLFLSLRGLYYKPIILDCLAYFKLLDDYHESSALFRVLNMEVFKVSHADIININKYARKKTWSLFEALKNINVIKDISADAVANINKLLGLVSKHSALAKDKLPSEIFVNFIWDAGLNKKDYDREAEYYSYLNQFYQKIKSFEANNIDVRIKDFMELMELELEAGETGALKLDFGDDEVVKIMTVHASKGLEFKYVFLVNLVDKRFPTINRRDKITIPDELVREKLAEGANTHTEEERRLFYVALTRAKQELYLTSAKDYGGAREKKVSAFVEEAGVSPKVVDISGAQKLELIKDLENLHKKREEKPQKYSLPSRFSFSQIEAYANCPLQYKFNFILKIPVIAKDQFIFGRVMHNVLKDFFKSTVKDSASQADLFGNSVSAPKPSLKDLMKIFDENWINDGYETKEKREEYKKKAKKILNNFYESLETEGWPNVLFLEKVFSLPIAIYYFRGAIDRVDELSDGSLEIVDYKTGTPKDKLSYAHKKQLILYKLAAEEMFGKKASKLTFHYLENNAKISFEASDKEVEKLQKDINDIIEKMKTGDFTPNPGPLCAYCDFRNICEFRK